MIEVLHVICDLAGGGAERLVLDLARGARHSRHSVAPVHPTGALRETFERHGIALHDLSRVRGRPGLGAILRMARLAGRFDLVHTHLWAGDTWGRLGAGLARHPAVLSTEHNTRPEDPWRQGVSVALHPLCRRVVGVSAAAAQMSIASGVPARKVCVVHNGVDLAGFEARPPRPGPLRTVLGLGRLVPQKGFDLAAAAVAGRPDLVLELLGEGPEASALQAAGARLLGWQADVRPHLARADVVVIPSRWEGFGLVAVEAMAAGVPVIAARIPALEEVVGDAGLLVPPEDAAALAAALQRLSETPALRRRLAEAGPMQAARFSLPRMIAAYEAIYDELLAARVAS